MAATIFYGFNASAGGAVAGDPATVRDEFEAALETGTIVRDGFGSYSTGLRSSLAVLAGAGAATASGNFNIVDEVGDPPTNGRFDTTGDANARWLLTPRSIVVALTPNRGSFGFFVTDISDFAGSLSITLVRADDVQFSYDLKALIPPESQANGALLFWGFVDQEDTYKEIRFLLTQESGDPDDWDYIGLDDFVTGDPSSAPPAPAPVQLAVTRGWGVNRHVLTVRMVPAPAPAPPPA